MNLPSLGSTAITKPPLHTIMHRTSIVLLIMRYPVRHAIRERRLGGTPTPSPRSRSDVTSTARWTVGDASSGSGWRMAAHQLLRTTGAPVPLLSRGHRCASSTTSPSAPLPASPSSSSPTSGSSSTQLPSTPQYHLVDLPEAVSPGCILYGHGVLSMSDEARLYQELRPVLERQGELSYVMTGRKLTQAEGAGDSRKSPAAQVTKHDGAGDPASNTQHRGPQESRTGRNGDDSDAVGTRPVRNVAADLHGFSDFTEARDWRTMNTRKIPGLKWSPTLLKFAQTIGKELLGVVPDSAQIVEHHLPGFEMHTERPVIGPQFLLLNLLNPCIVSFDDEATGRQGAMYMNARSVARISGELRWGWRFGERMADEHEEREFRPSQASTLGKRPPAPRRPMILQTDLRVSIVLFKMTASLLDQRKLLEQVDDAWDIAAKSESSSSSRRAAVGQQPQRGNVPHATDMLAQQRGNAAPRTGGKIATTTRTSASGVAAHPALWTPSSVTDDDEAPPTNESPFSPSNGQLPPPPDGSNLVDIDATIAQIASLSAAASSMAEGLTPLLMSPHGDQRQSTSHLSGDDQSAEGLPPTSSVVKENLEDKQRALHSYKEDMSRLQGFVTDLQRRSATGEGGGVTKEWIDARIAKATSGRHQSLDDKSPDAIVETAEREWKMIEDRAKEFRSRLAAVHHGTYPAGGTGRPPQSCVRPEEEPGNPPPARS